MPEVENELNTEKAKRLGLGCFVFAVGLLTIASGSGKPKTKDIPPKPIYTPDPEYTASARHDKVQGVVTVRLNLDSDGIPHDIKVVRGLRSDLDEKAIEAVSKWRFTPAIKDGKPTAVSLRVEVCFTLH